MHDNARAMFSSDRPLAVLLPGLDGTGDLFAPFVAAAPAKLECLIVRYPKDERMDYAALVHCAAAQIPPDRPIVLIAESFSGAIAVRLADGVMNGRVSALVLCNSFVTPPRWPLLRFAVWPLLFHLPISRRFAAMLMFGSFATPILEDVLSQALRSVARAVVAARIRLLLACDERAALKRIDVPVLYLRGTADRLVPEHAVREVAAALPTMQLRRIAAPHALLQAAPRAAWAAVAEFVGASQLGAQS
jgi:pimeloyl-ACP methyl ester carboxylesterase